ncbi:hypothetical protein Hdeb2414_s0014g00436361 [Helianthus debilis subsp. tardiflorus]
MLSKTQGAGEAHRPRPEPRRKPIFAPRLPPGALGAPRCARAPRRALFALLTT